MDNKWIKVGDKLPEIKSNDGYKKSVSVLVYVSGQIYLANNESNNEGEPQFNQWYCPAFDDIIDNVTHWMPLPDQPIE